MGTSDPFHSRGFGSLSSRLDGGLPVAEDLHGVVLFADLAGFTTLGEALAASGPVGSESLHGLLNGYFSILIDHVVAAGGEVTTFAGDALAAVFDGCRAGRDGTAARALRCAVDMQDALTGTPAVQVPGSIVRPHMRVGLGAGPLTRALVGHPDTRVLHVLAGVALERAVAAQAHSQEGEVLADAALVASVPGVHVATTRGPWSVLRSGAMTQGGAAAREPGGLIVAAPVEPGPGEATGALGRRLLDEHRPVTSVFLALPDMGVPRDGAARLQDYLAVAMPVIQRYDGELRQVDAGDKGYQLVIGFGAPRTAADDAERAVGCCLELVRLPSAQGRAGVATGPAFCAEVGTHDRREYVVIGDSVNVAARLAHVAGPGEIRIDAATSRRCAAFAQQRRLGPLRVKGRSVPVEAFAVEGLRETTSAPPDAAPPGSDEFVGRSGELAVARACRDRAYDAQGQVLLLTGDPGVGKSRLVAQLVSEAAGPAAGQPAGQPAGGTGPAQIRPGGQGVVAAGAGGVPGDARPYLAWRTIWRSLLLDPGPRPPTPADVQAVVANDGEDDRAPLLGAVLGIPVPDNAFTASLTPAQRADATRAVLLECLCRCCARAPVTVVIDDAHWLDELSQGLLEHLAANIGDLAVLLVVAAREEPRTADLLTRLRALPHCTSVPLAGLAPAEAERLVSARSGSSSRGETLAPDLVRRIALRGGGNPLFLEQLVTWARDQPGGAASDPSAELPPDVRRLVLARVDRLVPRGQATLKAASVVADAVSAASVHACLGPAGTPEQVERDLGELATLELLTTDRHGAEATYGFRHALVQEVVYGSLSSASRSELHEAVGEHLERTHAGELAAWVDRLAHHYGRSRNVGKQRTWFRAAGDAAARSYANEAALRYYEQLADVLPDPEKPEVLVRIGSIHQLTGRWREAEEVLRATLQAAGTALQPHVAAEAERELGLVLLATRRARGGGGPVAVCGRRVRPAGGPARAGGRARPPGVRAVRARGLPRRAGGGAAAARRRGVPAGPGRVERGPGEQRGRALAPRGVRDGDATPAPGVRAGAALRRPPAGRPHRQRPRRAVRRAGRPPQGRQVPAGGDHDR